MKKVIINIKPSHRIASAFKTKFPNASFYGAATLGSRSKSYLISIDEYEDNIELIKKFGTKARHQPFME